MRGGGSGIGDGRRGRAARGDDGTRKRRAWTRTSERLGARGEGRDGGGGLPRGGGGGSGAERGPHTEGGGATERGGHGRRRWGAARCDGAAWQSVSEDLQIPGISKKICHVTRKSAPERRHSPERCPPSARVDERARRFESRSETPPPSARRLGRSEMSPVNEDVAAVAKKMESILDHNLWPGFDKFKLVQVRADPPAAVPPRSTSSSSPPRRVPRARARASRRRSLARRAMSLFPRGRFFRPSVFFFRPTHN